MCVDSYKKKHFIDFETSFYLIYLMFQTVKIYSGDSKLVVYNAKSHKRN